MLRLLLPATWLTTLLACAAFEPAPELPTPDDPCGAWPDAGGGYKITEPGTGRRSWIRVLPDTEGPRDVLIMLHGAGGSGERMRQITAWQEVAKTEGWVTVYPDGIGALTGGTWNAGSCCGYAEQTGSDDVAYLDALADTLRTRVCADRIFAVGHSNGGMMASRWACEGKEVDLLVTSAGPRLDLGACEGDPIPVLATHGLDDDIVPYEGGTIETERFPPAVAAFDTFVDRNACDVDPDTVVQGDLTCAAYACEVPTTRCAISNWGHKWPGGDTERPNGPRLEDLVVDWIAAQSE